MSLPLSSLTHYYLYHYHCHGHDSVGMDQVVICRNIVNGRLTFPRSFNLECKVCSLDTIASFHPLILSSSPLTPSCNNDCKECFLIMLSRSLHHCNNQLLPYSHPTHPLTLLPPSLLPLLPPSISAARTYARSCWYGKFKIA